MKALQTEDIHKTFGTGPTATKVLRGISVEIETGEFVALMGPSGSGKSTFLSIVGTLLEPTSGRVEIAGQPALGLHERKVSKLRNRHLGFVFQFHHLLQDFTALENVLMPVYGSHSRVPPKLLSRARMLLDRVGLSDRIDFRATQLSGGQKQRVAIARSLIMTPELVLADEPTGNLDSKTSDDVIALLKELCQDEETAFLISTHDGSVAKRCQRLIRLVDGSIVHDGSTDAV